MFYVFRHTITTGDIITAKKEIEMDLSQGVIHQVDILFEDGCDHEAHVQIFLGSHQLWPSNTGGSIVGNATVISFREFIEIISGSSDLKAKVWGDGTITGVDVAVQIGMLPKQILMPLSFDDLLKAARGY